MCVIKTFYLLFMPMHDLLFLRPFPPPPLFPFASSSGSLGTGLAADVITNQEALLL